MRQVTVNGVSWKDFDPDEEIVRLGLTRQKMHIVAEYERANGWD
jgi:hypothetical protein